MKKMYKWSLPLVAALTMTACGGDSGSSGDDNGSADPSPGAGETTAFTDSAQWVVAPQANSENCFDFESNGNVDCSGTAWDLKLVMGTLTPDFFTNSGESGEGDGGTLGSPFEYSWATLQQFASGMEDNEGNALNIRSYLADSLDNAFTDSSNAIGSAFLEYTETHQLLANYGVILVTTDSSTAFTESDSNVFAVQITGYYGGGSGSESGHISLRWINVGDYTSGTDTTVHTATVDATSYSDWTHFDLATGTVVDSPDASNWQLAFQRYFVKTNSGVSGEGTVGSFFAQQPDGFYDAEGNAITAAFSDSSVIAAAEDALTDTSGWAEWTTGQRGTSWNTDAAFSSLNPDSRGGYPNLIHYGFYSYDPTGDVASAEHMVVAAPDNGVMLRSGDGNSYARVHLTSVTYADSTDPYSQSTWTFDFEVQPAADD